MNKKLKILIADDHPLMRKGIRAAIEDEPDIEHIAEADNGETAYDRLKKESFDIALVDIEMPKLGGIGLAQRILKEKIKTKIIFLTMHKDEDIFEQAMDVGANGYLLKENAAEDVVQCIRTVQNGEYFISPAISGYLVKRSQKKKEPYSAIPYVDELTTAERNILKLISEEKTSQQIADELFISPKTVENHRNNISKKLHLSGTHSLLKFALSHKEHLKD
ncbi:MAG: response regulator transcription factor [Bacteroidota bacterium]|jgi:DNA-binding NarL/FixJ family response regulator